MNQPISTTRSMSPRRGFTLLELLIVIGLIVLLISILVPVIGTIRQAAQRADTQNFMSVLQNAIERYNQDFRAYPGPLANDELRGGSAAVNMGGFDRVTGSENLVLGLLGGLRRDGGGVVFDAARVGQGPAGLNPALPRSYSAYLSADGLSEGRYTYADTGFQADDTNIPEFVDRFPNPMPILYLRANVGRSGVIATNNNTQFNHEHIAGYTGLSGGNAIGLPGAGNPHPLNDLTAAVDYVRNDSLGDVPYGFNGYILISAGADRIYGTNDDITSFSRGQ